MDKYDLEDRLIDFSIRVSKIVDSLDNSKLGNQIGNQLTRCSLSPALNYGEAQSAESVKDFIHKLKISLKELRETMVCLKIIERRPLIKNPARIQLVIKENNELISILVSSIKTAQKNLDNQRPSKTS